MKQSITAVHIECVRRLYNDHDEHYVSISNFLQKKLRSRSRHAAIAKEILLQIVALTSGFVNLHNEICEGLIRVGAYSITLVDNFWEDYSKKFDWKSLRNVIGSVSKNDWESLIKFDWKFLIKSSWKSLRNFLKGGCKFTGKVTPQKKTAQY